MTPGSRGTGRVGGPCCPRTARMECAPGKPDRERAGVRRGRLPTSESRPWLPSCPIPNTYTHVIENGDSSKAQFKLKIFSFINNSIVYLHCRLRVCMDAPGTTCKIVGVVLSRTCACTRVPTALRRVAPLAEAEGRGGSGARLLGGDTGPYSPSPIKAPKELCAAGSGWAILVVAAKLPPPGGRATCWSPQHTPGAPGTASLLRGDAYPDVSAG